MSPPLDKLLDPAYWQALAPHLSISQTPDVAPATAFGADLLDRASDTLQREGYFALPPVLGNDILHPLRQGIEAMVAAGWPAAFVYVYDEAWQLFHRLDGFLSHFLGDGFALLPHFWAWHVPTNAGAAGWPPHVDYAGESAFGDFLMTLSLWIPLTDATPENGCMSVLPMSRQKLYDPPVSEPHHIRHQDVRALPARAGSLLGWRQDLWHWSGRSSADATEPRISLSLEFQNMGFDPLVSPVYDIRKPPAPRERLKIICAQMAKYDHMETISPQVFDAARIAAMP